MNMHITLYDKLFEISKKTADKKQTLNGLLFFVGSRFCQLNYKISVLFFSFFVKYSYINSRTYDNIK